MELKPGYYIVRGEDDGPEGHIERLEEPYYSGAMCYWDTIGSEVGSPEPDGDIIAGPFTMAEISAALRTPAEPLQIGQAPVTTSSVTGFFPPVLPQDFVIEDAETICRRTMGLPAQEPAAMSEPN